jgi:hypothetical protein
MRVIAHQSTCAAETTQIDCSTRTLSHAEVCVVNTITTANTNEYPLDAARPGQAGDVLVVAFVHGH